MKIIDAVKRLERAGAENSKMTKKLKDSAKTVAEEITSSVGEAKILPRGYRVVERVTNLSTELFLVHEGEYGDEYIDGMGQYLHGDFNCWIPEQTREACFRFANDIATGLLGEIAELLEKETSKQKNSSRILEEKG